MKNYDPCRSISTCQAEKTYENFHPIDEMIHKRCFFQSLRDTGYSEKSLTLTAVIAILMAALVLMCSTYTCSKHLMRDFYRMHKTWAPLYGSYACSVFFVRGKCICVEVWRFSRDFAGAQTWTMLNIVVANATACNLFVVSDVCVLIPLANRPHPSSPEAHFLFEKRHFMDTVHCSVTHLHNRKSFTVLWCLCTLMNYYRIKYRAFPASRAQRHEQTWGCAEKTIRYLLIKYA